jgi:hypothetical protein
MMPEFKVGDKVRRISNSVRGDLFGYIGEVLIIRKIDGTEVWFEGRPSNSSIDRYELVEEAMDLTKIEKPFGLLDKATQQALKDHGGPIEVYSGNGHWKLYSRHYWVSLSTTVLNNNPRKPRLNLS